MDKHKKQKNNGFTIVMLMGVGSLVVSSNSAKASQKLRIAVDNVNFAMESMTRELRMGTHYYSNSTDYTLSNDDLVNDYNGGTYIAFNPQSISGPVNRVGYYRKLRSDGVTYALQRCEYTVGCSDIVSKDVNIEIIKFYVSGSSLPASSDTVQPSVRILIKGSVTLKGDVTHFSLQTLAAQRSAEK